MLIDPLSLAPAQPGPLEESGEDMQSMAMILELPAPKAKVLLLGSLEHELHSIRPYLGGTQQSDAGKALQEDHAGKSLRMIYT